MLMSVGKFWMTYWSAIIGLHDSLGQKKVSEQGSHQKILSKQLLEGVSRKGVPGNGVRDGREDPIKFPQHGSSVTKLTGDLLQLVHFDLRGQMSEVIGHHKPSEGHLDGSGQTGREQVRSCQLGIHGQQLVLTASCQLDTVSE